MTSEANQHSLVTVSGKHSALHRRGQGCVKTAFVLISFVASGDIRDTTTNRVRSSVKCSSTSSLNISTVSESAVRPNLSIRSTALKYFSSALATRWMFSGLTLFPNAASTYPFGLFRSKFRPASSSLYPCGSSTRSILVSVTARTEYFPHPSRDEPVQELTLSLRFNHREFCGELYGCHKTPSLPIFVDSSSLLEGRVAFGSAREATFWPSGRSSAGFRRLRGRAEFHQKRRNNAVYSNRCQAAGAVAPLPRQPPIRNTRPRYPELGESSHHQPRPAVRLLGMTHSRRCPSQGLFEKAEGMLQVEAPHISSPDEVEIGLSLTMPPQPQHARLSPPLAARQPLHLYQHKRPNHDGQRPTAATPFVRSDLRMQVRPGAHAHRSVASVPHTRIP